MKQRTSRLWVRSLFVLSLLVYVASFFLPTFDIVFDGKSDPEPGCVAFLVCFFNGYGQDGVRPFIVWLANPAFWIAGLNFAVERGRKSAIWAAVAVLLGLPFAFCPLILVGYYVWLGSMGLLLSAALGLVFTHRMADARTGRRIQSTTMNMDDAFLQAIF